MFDLKDKVAIVTGSSRGIGRATAEILAAAGARVVVSSRKAGPCEEVAEGIRARGGEAIVIPCHVGEKAASQTLVDETVKTWGRVDILVCNAASNPVYGPMRDVEDEAFDKIMGNNVRSNFWLANMVAPGMADRGQGSIIIISSIVGFTGSENIGIYAISKAADAQLARNLAVEWGKKGIRANCISPGLIRTDFAKALFENPKAEAYVNKLIPLGRAGEPDDIAGAVLFLASDASRYMSGQNMVVDGGVTIADTLS